MTPKVVEVIKEFRELQTSLSDFGAKDVEPSGTFRRVVKLALDNKSVDWVRLDWQLYTSVPGHSPAARRLTRKAVKVYRTIQKHARVADIQSLRDFTEG